MTEDARYNGIALSQSACHLGSEHMCEHLGVLWSSKLSTCRKLSMLTKLLSQRNYLLKRAGLSWMCRMVSRL